LKKWNKRSESALDSLEIEKGGRRDEVDLFGKPGGYQRLMDSRAAGKPCTTCGRIVEKKQYLGGACYFCPRCQG
jgi:formamidopyrimidine-DNA glycosylase